MRKLFWLFLVAVLAGCNDGETEIDGCDSEAVCTAADGGLFCCPDGGIP